jgi:hypothetical protein
MFGIQKNVPMPEVNRTPKVSRRKYNLEGMSVGDMIFVPGRTSNSVSAYISRITNNVAGKFSVRHCWMVANGTDARGATIYKMSAQGEQDAVEGTGVWRTE